MLTDRAVEALRGTTVRGVKAWMWRDANMPDKVGAAGQRPRGAARPAAWALMRLDQGGAGRSASTRSRGARSRHFAESGHGNDQSADGLPPER